MGNHTEVQDTWNDISPTRPFKLTREMLDAIEERMKLDDETTATQLVKMLGERSFKISTRTVERARKTLGWTFHGSRYCQLIRNANKEKRVYILNNIITINRKPTTVNL